MSIEGVWKVEMGGAYGWQQLGTAFLHDGRYLGASADHYTIGSYESDGDTIKMILHVIQYGKVRTIFGRKKKKFDVQAELKRKKSGKIVGVGRPCHEHKFDVKMRLTPLDKLD